MKKSYIEMQKCLTHEEIIKQPGAFEYNPRGRFPWIQKICCWILDKCQAHYMMKVQKYTYGPLDGKDLKDQLFKMINEIYGWDNFNTNENVIVIGSDEFANLINDKEIIRYFEFTVDIKIGNKKWAGYKIFNIRTIIVPWVKGMAIIPLK